MFINVDNIIEGSKLHCKIENLNDFLFILTNFQINARTTQCKQTLKLCFQSNSDVQIHFLNGIRKKNNNAPNVKHAFMQRVESR